jgi:hypothetical protein
MEQNPPSILADKPCKHQLKPHATSPSQRQPIIEKKPQTAVSHFEQCCHFAMQNFSSPKHRQSRLKSAVSKRY